MKVITTVGTSIFENYQKETSRNLPYYDELEESFYRNRDACKGYIDDLQYDEVFLLWIDNNFNTSSAEITSLLAIQEEIKDALEVYLIATETILSRIAAEIIQKKLNGYNAIDGKTIKVFFDADKKAHECDVIEGLDVKDADHFSDTGLPNLIERLKVLGINNEKIILNITGGYKGLIPYLTVLGQIYSGVDIMYLYENTQKVISIPKLPINFDAEYAEDYAVYLDSEYLINPLNVNVNNELENKRLVFKDRNRYRLTAGGELLKHYISKNSAFLGKTTLGFSFELIVLEYYQNKYHKEFNINRGVKSIDNKSISSDIDLLLEKNNEYICVSVKAFNKVRSEDGFEKTKKQFECHIDYFKTNSLSLISYHHIIYLYKNRDMGEVNANLLELKKLLIKSYPCALFEVFYVEIPTDTMDPYQNIFKKGLNQNSSIKQFSLLNHV
jgi:CRISPR/Cas system-associated protein Csm6